MFGSKSKSSSASSSTAASINSSGWVVGGGSATGGALNSSTGSGFKLPVAAWLSLAAVALSYVYFKNKKG